MADLLLAQQLKAAAIELNNQADEIYRLRETIHDLITRVAKIKGTADDQLPLLYIYRLGQDALNQPRGEDDEPT